MCYCSSYSRHAGQDRTTGTRRGGMSTDTLSRLRKVCGLLGSEHEGERAAAAKKATEILKAGRMTWADVSFGVNDFAKAYAAAEAAHVYKRLFECERDHTAQMAKEIARMKREVKRLKGMWPSGQPGRAA